MKVDVSNRQRLKFVCVGFTLGFLLLVVMTIPFRKMFLRFYPNQRPRNLANVTPSYGQQFTTNASQRAERKSEVNCSSKEISDVSLTDIYLPAVKFFSAESVGLRAAKTVYGNVTSFYPRLNPIKKLRLLKTYLVMATALERARIPFVVTDELLLGVYRFSGMLPWEVHTGVMVNVERREDVQEVLSCIEDFGLTTTPEMMWTFSYSDNAMNTSETRYLPVTISFYKENSTHVITIQNAYSDPVVFPKKALFPVRWAFMEGIQVPVPHDMHAVLASVYKDLHMCASPSSLQKHQRQTKSDDARVIPCERLWPIYGRLAVP